MSKFINTCVNYSEINVLKNLLKPLLIDFNNHLVDVNEKQFNLRNDQDIVIPNNGIKYYMFVSPKVSTNFKTLYFFPENFTCEHYEFFMEVENSMFKHEKYLFEGFLYNNNNFLVSDILFINTNLVKTDYYTRFNLINDNIPKPIHNINGFFNISIHHYLSGYDLLQFFSNNFFFKNELTQLEIINNNNFQKTIKLLQSEKLNSNKLIEKTKIVELYNVYNLETKNHEGVLYIKSIKDSKIIKDLCKNKDSTIIECKWNKIFNKWSLSV